MDAQALSGLILPFGFLVIMYFFLIRPQKKREKEIQEMRSNISVGDKIVTIGGIMGTVTVVKDDMVTIEVGPTKTRLELTKWAVGTIITGEEEI